MYIFFQKSYWCGNSYSETNNNYEAHTSKNNSSFEKEPLYLKPGIQIRNLRKVYNLFTCKLFSNCKITLLLWTRTLYI